jgi:hypothetical protein
MNKFVWNAITQGARILVGALFIFSGVITLLLKLNGVSSQMYGTFCVLLA